MRKCRDSKGPAPHIYKRIMRVEVTCPGFVPGMLGAQSPRG
ncbi:hypothetical protein Pyrfu_0616 [Pyrolobus fumarii 1A]|uniref:Uncharacterized protein n=1 Tax=Pyrolobus fumarii (strain DSM 11204 / 1A) TaxID=694429 RepID=G0EH35_PYRF1|nr:hypothetical protein Pyrfu_0616 [Pyrolobus fumarii 1A]